MANRLAGATSPYLLQHASNPVDWWEWGPDAFAEAKRRDTPILLSVGYSACHWCQVSGPWLAARPALQEQLGAATGVLLAYGLERPRGQAGQWHREQVTWLDAAISVRGLPRFWVGDAPRHPSRWQRCTSRRQPNIPFRDAVALELRPAPASQPVTAGLPTGVDLSN